MSRSTKLPWVSDSAKSHMKPIHARKMRRRVKQMLSVFKHETEDYDVGIMLPLDDELTNPYDICDYRFYYTVCPKSYRK